jgi:hypothetical protein
VFPTLAYIEDQLAARADRLFACGFGPDADELRRELQAEGNLEVEPLRARFGAPDQFNAGLLGYIESSEDF